MVQMHQVTHDNCLNAATVQLLLLLQLLDDNDDEFVDRVVADQCKYTASARCCCYELIMSTTATYVIRHSF